MITIWVCLTCDEVWNMEKVQLDWNKECPACKGVKENS